MEPTPYETNKTGKSSVLETFGETQAEGNEGKQVRYHQTHEPVGKNRVKTKQSYMQQAAGADPPPVDRDGGTDAERQSGSGVGDERDVVRERHTCGKPRV